MSSIKKIEKKNIRRKERVKSEHQKKIKILNNLKYYSKYPSIKFINENKEFVDEGFADIVKEIVRGIKFSDRKLFPEWQEKFYIEFKKQDGTYNTDERLELVSKVYDGNLPVNGALMQLLYTYGEIIFSNLMRRDLCDKYIPFQMFYFEPYIETLNIRLVALCREKSKFGTIYYSHLLPKIVIGGEEKTVGFSKHSIERIIKRTLYNNKTYTGASELLRFLNNYYHYELVTVAGSDLLTFYDYGASSFDEQNSCSNIVTEMAKHILGEKYICTECYYYRVGYMPIGVSVNFASGITLLLPGMRGTPEYELLNTSSRYRGMKDLIAENLKTIPKITEQVRNNSNLELLKYFHDNGIPQIITLDTEPYKTDH